MRRLLYGSLFLLFLLHNDWWLWSDGRLVVGLPVGLVYHLVYCLVVVVVMALVVRFAWPRGLEEEE